MGDPDLSSEPGTPSLAERMRGGDAKAISTFRELHLRQMQSYCQVACSPRLVDEAVAAGFVDFLGRITERPLNDVDLEPELLRAIRSAAAGRMPVESGGPDCSAVPELLAAETNGELAGDHRALRDHLADCAVCQQTQTRMRRAEGAFHPPEVEVPEVEVPEVEVPEPEPVPEPVPVPEPEPEPEPVPEPPAATPAPPTQPPPPTVPAPPLPSPVVRRRRGGLVGAIRKRIRPPVS